MIRCSSVFFFFNDTATTEIYTLSLHDALPISDSGRRLRQLQDWEAGLNENELTAIHGSTGKPGCLDQDRKSTRLNSSHANISYAVFCLKKKNQGTKRPNPKTSRPRKADRNT